jgi:uroporphyrinogen-III synthase
VGFVKPAVLTRDGDGARRYVGLLAELGLFTVPTPVTTTAPADAADRARLAVACRAGTFDWILVASARAVAPLIEAGGPGAARILAVGPATADALAARGLFAETSTAATGEGAADVLIARTARRVLIPRAEGGRDEAIALLREVGVEVEAVVAYRTVPAAADDPALAAGLAALRSGAVGVCAVFAPSQVAALDAVFGIRKIAAPFAAIGETTAAALRAAGAAVVAVADGPTPEGLAKAVSAVYPLRS